MPHPERAECPAGQDSLAPVPLEPNANDVPSGNEDAKKALRRTRHGANLQQAPRRAARRAPASLGPRYDTITECPVTQWSRLRTLDARDVAASPRRGDWGTDARLGMDCV